MKAVYPQPPFPGAVAIYSLSDPRTGAVRYIGKALALKPRYQKHLTLQKGRKHARCARWIAVLRSEGLCPILTVIEWVTVDVWREAERRHIALSRAAGCDLTNLTDGGDGSLGCHPSEETREKMRQAHRQRWANDPERRAGMSSFFKEVNRTCITPEGRSKGAKRAWAADPERRQRASDAAKEQLAQPGALEHFTGPGQKSPLRRTRLAQRNRDPEFRKQNSNKAKARLEDPEVRRVLDAAREKAHQDPAKMAAGIKRSWDNDPERKKRASEQGKALLEDPEKRAAWGKIQRLGNQDREKHAEATRASWARDPERRAQQSERAKKQFSDPAAAEDFGRRMLEARAKKREERARLQAEQSNSNAPQPEG